jgi:hypothetical protein
MPAKRTLLSVQATPDSSKIRTASLFSQDYTVIPCVALVEGVLWPGNATAPELALAEEFGRFPEGWNGRPVVYDHPRVEGIPVSASSPSVLEDNAFGQMFNTILDGTKLKTEIWINEARVAKLSPEAQAVVEDLKTNGSMVEVSTGLFMMAENVEGVFDGQEYSAIWRNVVPDHLAILPAGVRGACSVADGCGAPRANDMKPVMRASQLNANCGCGVPNTNDSERQGIFKRLLDLAGGFLSFKSNSDHLSDRDLRTALNAALGTTEPDQFFFILAVYANNEDGGKFVYEMGFDGTLFERSFSVADGGAITLDSTVVPVRPVTTFVPVNVVTGNSNNQENVMTKQELVNALVANDATQYTEEDREWLTSLDEAKLNRMAPKVNAEVPAPAEPLAETPPAVAVAPVANAGAPTTGKPVTTEEYIAAAPAELRQVLNSGLAMHRQRKDAIVGALMANSRNKFNKVQLESKDIGELECLVALSATDVSYVGAGANLAANSGDDEAIPAAPSIFAPRANAA